MTRSQLASLPDHSLLKAEATEGQILAEAATVRDWGIGFYCVQPCHVGLAARLTREQKMAACRLVQGAGAAFVKTSTGFLRGIVFCSIPAGEVP